jgi:hypothetical protein
MHKEIINVRQYLRSSEFALLHPSYDTKKIKVNAVIDSKPSRYISYITDAENNKYVIKQKRQGGVRKQFQVVFEKVSGHIAYSLQIPAHRVELLPAGMAFPGKIITDRAAAILTLVPGVPAGELTGTYANLDMRQSNRPDWSKSKLGLHEGVVKSMAVHPDLPRMAALDTFLGIKGRGPANYFYDKATDHFYMIDMDKTFNISGGKDLISGIACDHVRAWIKAKKVFKQTEIQGLQLYKETLQQLVDMFPPARIHELMDNFSAASGFKKAYLPEIASRVDRIKDAVTRSHKHILELIDLLSEFISYGRKNGVTHYREIEEIEESE